MRSALLIFALFALASCGFRPVYGKQYQSERSAVTAGLDEVGVSVGNSRLDQLLGEELRDKLDPERKGYAKKYTLKVVATETNIPLFVAPDGTYGRGNIQFKAYYTLTRVVDNKQIHSDSVTQISSYAASETNAMYGSYIAQQDARKRGVIELAHRLAMAVGNRLNDDTQHGEPTGDAVQMDPMVMMPDTHSLTTMGIDR